MLATTISSWITLICGTLEARGVDPQPLLDSAGIERAQLSSPTARISTARATRLWHLAVDATADQCFGLEVGKRWHPTSFHALGFAWLASDTLEEGMRRLCRYTRVITTVAQVELIEQDDVAELRIGKDPAIAAYLEPAPAALDAGLTSFLTMCRICAGEDFAPLGVVVERPRPDCSDRYRKAFGADIRYSADRNAMRFATEQLYRPLPSGNLELAHVNEQIIAQYLAGLDREDTAMAVKAFLVDRLPSGDVREETVAAQLHMSLRSLQRRLQEQGTTYKSLLEQTRRELAERYVRGSDLSVNEITFLLGFTEPANFSRAFKRWHGVSPSAYREAYAQGN